MFRFVRSLIVEVQRGRGDPTKPTPERASGMHLKILVSVLCVVASTSPTCVPAAVDNTVDQIAKMIGPNDLTADPSNEDDTVKVSPYDYQASDDYGRFAPGQGPLAGAPREAAAPGSRHRTKRTKTVHHRGAVHGQITKAVGA